jgi:dihydrodipicolinate synthase/N-acetylneuraminate lyase
MDRARLRRDLEGCYVTVPTMFRDPDLGLDLAAIRAHVRFLIDAGLTGKNAVFLAGGAAGDFSTMTFAERVAVAETVIAEANRDVPVAMGAQTTSTRELQQLARAAASLGASFIQVSCPFYFAHTEDDFFAYVAAAAEAASVGIIIYNTFWTSAALSFRLMERFLEIPAVVGLKWACPRTDAMEFEDVTSNLSPHITIIDNHLQFAASHMLGARGFEVHLCNFWPEWGVRLIKDLSAGNYVAVQTSLVREAMPFYKLWTEIEREFTSGDGYLDKLCMELVGLPSSRCRPPTRDIRDRYRERARQMLRQIGAPRILDEAGSPHRQSPVPTGAT